MSSTPDTIFLRDFFRSLQEKPLPPKDPRYVDFYGEGTGQGEDPMELMARAIEYSEGESVQLLSGFRGTGKSTELRRLKKRLEAGGLCNVVLMDAEDYLNLSDPLDVTDFLIALAAAFSDGLLEAELLGQDPTEESFSTRFGNFFKKTEVHIPEVAIAADVPLGPGGNIKPSLKVALKSDPSFRKLLRERMANHLGALQKEVQAFFLDCRERVRKQAGNPSLELVMIVDSLERLRGTSQTDAAIQASVENLFAGHADKLRLEGMHVVYTVPPYLRVLHPGIGGLYGGGAVQVLPSVKLRLRDGKTQVPRNLDKMREVVAKRGVWKRLFEDDQSLLDLVIDMSGGQLRDLMRIMTEVVRSTTTLPANKETVEAAVSRVRNDYLPIANNDAVWLAKVAATHEASLDDVKELPTLARFFDTHVVLCYRNGEEWYDIHPLIKDVVRKQADAVKAAAQK